MLGLAAPVDAFWPTHSMVREDGGGREHRVMLGLGLLQQQSPL